MKNITLSIDEKTLDEVRVIAAKQRTTVNRLVRDYLSQLANSDRDVESARERLLKLIDESPGRMGPDWKWNREDAYEGRILPRHQHPDLRSSRKRR